MLRRQKAIVSNEKARKVKKQEKFRSTICRKGVGSNSIFCQFFKYWVHKRCTGVRGRLKQDDEFNYRSRAIRKQAAEKLRISFILVGQEDPEGVQLIT